VNERRTVVGGGLIGHCVSPQPWREIDAHETKSKSHKPVQCLICRKRTGGTLLSIEASEASRIKAKKSPRCDRFGTPVSGDVEFMWHLAGHTGERQTTVERFNTGTPASVKVGAAQLGNKRWRFSLVSTSLVEPG